ncbi:zinc finger protein-domain-containing protein [Cladorrhinum sp. PSN259]|nr:zinc finger protein-domain-containing protein [Cladorrhinum sp. PSN259]
MSTTPPSAVLHRAQQEVERPVPYQKIGFGQCGLVFTKPGHGHVVKVARPYFSDGLWNDFLSHLRLLQALHFERHIKIPRVYSYVPRASETWWAANKPCLPPATHFFPLPSEALITERIPTLPATLRHALIDNFCPETLKGAAKTSPLNTDSLVRVYLGRRHQPQPGAPPPPPPPNFSLRNFNFCLDQLLQFEFPVEEYARVMGRCLATIHWQARMDGYDIEFVLGGSDPEDAENSYTTYLTQSSSAGLDVEQLEDMPMHSDIEALLSQPQPQPQAGVFSRGDNSQRGADKSQNAHASTYLWVLDFNLCTRFPKDDDSFILQHEDEVINQLVLAFFENDPYYPLPLMETDVDKNLWSVFSKEYGRKAEEILSKDLAHLPVKFLNACVEREKRKLQEGLGHGHRDFKG